MPHAHLKRPCAQLTGNYEAELESACSSPAMSQMLQLMAQDLRGLSYDQEDETTFPCPLLRLLDGSNRGAQLIP